MTLKKHIPNFITLLNLLTGCIAVIFILRNNLTTATWLVGLAAIFDFIDGFAARMLNVNNPIGKELDSLADVISFGLVPGLIIMVLIEYSLPAAGIQGMMALVIPYIGLLIPAFSALRLAKFNIDHRQSDGFIGLPTPANALLIASFPLILQNPATLTGHSMSLMSGILSGTFFLILITLVLSFLLVSGLPLFSLKFKSFRWSDNKMRYIFLLLSLILLLILSFTAVPCIILLYIILSLLNRNKTITSFTK